MAVISHKAQRVAVLIDAQNLYHSARHLYKHKVNFGEILKEALGERSLVRAIAYVISTEAGDEKQFFDALTRVGIETKTKDLQIFIDGSKKADWDVGIAIDAVRLAEKVDVIVIVSGDGDFVPLVTYLKNKVQVEGMNFLQSTSSKLIESLDAFTDLGKDSKRFLLGGPSMQHSSRRTSQVRAKKK